MAHMAKSGTEGALKKSIFSKAINLDDDPSKQDKKEEDSQPVSLSVLVKNDINSKMPEEKNKKISM